MRHVFNAKHPLKQSWHVQETERSFCHASVVRAGAAKAGYAGFMVTVDAPRLGNRISDERNK